MIARFLSILVKFCLFVCPFFVRMSVHPSVCPHFRFRTLTRTHLPQVGNLTFLSLFLNLMRAVANLVSCVRNPPFGAPLTLLYYYCIPDAKRGYYGFIIVVVRALVRVHVRRDFLLATYSPHFFPDFFHIWQVT